MPTPVSIERKKRDQHAWSIDFLLEGNRRTQRLFPFIITLSLCPLPNGNTYCWLREVLPSAPGTWLLIETKRFKSTASELVDWKAQLQQYKTSFEAEYAVLWSPFLIVVAHDEVEFECRLDKISIEEASKIYSFLGSSTHIREKVCTLPIS